MKQTLKQAVTLLLLLFLTLGVFPRSIFALNYGECEYGVGTYSDGGCLTASSTPTPIAPICGDVAPGVKAPWLYAVIAQDDTSVLLYFTKADDPVNKYVLEYGTKSGDYVYGALDMGVNLGGQMTFLVKSLSPNTTYYFRVRGGNGCATGPWSNELSVKTKSLATFSQLLLTVSDLTTIPLPDNRSVSESEESKNEETELAVGYDIKIKVVDTSQQPVNGATVTLHSNPQTALTDRDGIVEFNDVVPGNHRVLIAFNGLKGEQTINLTGDVQQFSFTITIQSKNALLEPQVLVIIGAMALVIITLLILLIRKKNKTPAFKKLN